MQRVASAIVVILALLAFAAAGYVLVGHNAVRDAGRVLAVPSLAGNDRPTPSSSSPSAGKVIAFLGDGWTAGYGASTGAKRFSSLVSATLGLQQRNFGSGGTGYAKRSTGGAYVSRVGRLVATHPDIVVVSGGRNDTTDLESTAVAGMQRLFKRLHHQLPDATIIAVQPMWGYRGRPRALAPITAAVKAAVLAHGGHFLTIGDPLLGHPSYMRSAVDPGDKGYAAIAAAMTPGIRAILGG